MSERPILCRWHHEELVLDVLPVEKHILGFTNPWYKGALNAASSITLPSGSTISIITAPFFLGTKMEAFRGRGKNDFFASHDLEDVIAVMDGRNSIADEISTSPSDLREYLANAITSLLQQERFLEALPGYVRNDERVPQILRKLQEISRLA